MSLFPTTRWSLFVERGGESDRREIWDYLARVYWKPLRVVAVGRGFSPEDADDAVQQFFQKLIEEEFIDKPNLESGRLRSFLRNAFENFLICQRRRAMAQKRGGGAIHVDCEDEPLAVAGHPQPDEAYDRQCAIEMIEEAVRRSQEHYASRPHHFKILLAVDDGDLGQEEAWKQLNCSPGNGRVALSRFRSRVEQKLREVIRESVDPQFPEIIDDELKLVLKYSGK
jgi:DNA-directed RNA polymerase specialized sigma24 family protein